MKHPSFLKKLTLATVLALSALTNACGPAFTGAEFSEGGNNAGQAGFTNTAIAGSDSEAGRVGSAEAGASPVSGTAGLSGAISSQGGGTSSGGSAGTPTVRECLSNYASLECALPCTGSAYPACRQLLDCMIEKNVGPAQSPLDPCYGTGYQEYDAAKAAYKACCN